ncbi:MAG: energy transducer TonB [Roseomonas sp.]|nr:energy transducer TonB [Roseomonas sp.]
MKAAPRGFGLGASLTLHGLVAALLILWPVIEEFSADQAEAQGIAVIYERAPEIGMPEPPAAPPEVAAVPPAPEVPPPPPPMPPPPAVVEAPPPPPPPVDLAEVPLPPPPPPAPVAEPLPELAEKPPEPPREVAEAPPERRPPPRQSAPQTAAPQPVRLNAALRGMESFTLEGRTTPPEAADAARNRRPNYPEASRRRGEQGVVRVELLVDPNGRVVDVRVLESSGFNTLDAEAVKTVRDWRFRPAQRAGVPVAGSITTAVHFRLATERR